MVRCRLAKIEDLSAIVAFAAKLYPQSNYAAGGLPFNAVIARRTCKSAMTNKDSRVWVTTKDGVICGFLICIVGPMMFTHYAGGSDLFFMAEAGGDKLIDAAVHWCKLRGVARIDMGISAGVGDREETFKRLWRRKGFMYSGPVFSMNLLPAGDAP